MAFLAFQPDLAQRRQLLEQIASYSQQFTGVSWEHWQDLHITVKFFSGWQPTDLLQMTDICAAVINEIAIAPFSIHLTAPGCFLHEGAAKILWLGVDGGRCLSQLAASLDQELHRSFQLPTSAKPYRPHLTLARVHDSAAFPVADWYALSQTKISFEAEELLLMKRRSGVKRCGNEALYEVLTSVKLPISRT